MAKANVAMLDLMMDSMMGGRDAPLTRLELQSPGAVAGVVDVSVLPLAAPAHVPAAVAAAAPDTRQHVFQTISPVKSPLQLQLDQQSPAEHRLQPHIPFRSLLSIALTLLFSRAAARPRPMRPSAKCTCCSCSSSLLRN
jgi:hypothetical protein